MKIKWPIHRSKTKKQKNVNEWEQAHQKYLAHRAIKNKKRQSRIDMITKWHRSSKTFSWGYRIFFNMMFYCKQIIKAFLWIFVFGSFPKWTLSQWMHELVFSTVSGKVYMAEMNDIRYWNMLAVATTLYAFYRILKMKWTPPAFKMTPHELRQVHKARRIMRKRKRMEYDKSLLNRSRSILGMNKDKSMSTQGSTISKTIKPTKRNLHHAINKSRKHKRANRKKHSHAKSN